MDGSDMSASCLLEQPPGPLVQRAAQDPVLREESLGVHIPIDRLEAERASVIQGRFLTVQGAEAGFALPGGVPTGSFARGAQVTEELLAAAKSPRFIERARSLGFSDEAIEALSTRIRSVKVGEIPAGGWSDAEQILIGRRGLITPTREGRIFHELGHVLDDIRSPGL